MAKDLAYYESLEKRLQKIYGECDDLLEKAVRALEQQNTVPDGTSRSILLTDEDFDDWEDWYNANKEGRLIIQAESSKPRQDNKPSVEKKYNDWG